MFGIFKKKIIEPSVTDGDKAWIEQNMLWFLEVFGVEEILKNPFILPTYKNFPYNNVQSPEQFDKLFEQLCKYYQIDSACVIIKFFDDIQSKQWSTYLPFGNHEEPMGTYYESFEGKNKRFTIRIAKSLLADAQKLVAVLAHELAHAKLLGGNFVQQTEPGMEPLTDLATIFFGFGIFVANSCITSELSQVTRIGYLPINLISYANALVCFISGKRAEDFIQHINHNTWQLFKQDYEYLAETNDTLLNPYKIKLCNEVYRAGKEIDEAYKNKKYEDAIKPTLFLIEQNPKNSNIYNSLGYTKMLLEDYTAAIADFTKAIDLDPYFDYPYNNRGYCRLLLNDTANAYADIHSAFEMNPDNSFAWRNMGVYFLKTGKYEKAVEYLEQAYKMDPETELTEQYLSEVYLLLGDTKKAKEYKDNAALKNS